MAGGRFPLLVLTGPTGSGKTGLAARIASALGAEIVCADSRQVFRGVEIGAASPTAAEMALAPHHLYGVLDPSEPVSAGGWRAMAEARIAEIHARGAVPLLVGGTGLYIQALAGGLELAPPADPALVSELEERARMGGPGPLWDELYAADPEGARGISRNDPFRIIRSLALVRREGRPLAEIRGTRQVPWTPLSKAALEMEREELYRRIDSRVDRMLEMGLMDEAKRLKDRGLSPALPALRAIGYGHLFRAMDGELTVSEAAELIKRDSRRYAKRQMTWFHGREPGLRWFPAGDASAAERLVSQYFRDMLV